MSQSTRWDVALQQLRDAPTPQLRSEAIDRMTELLQQSEWVLPDGRGGEVAEALQQVLVDSNWYALALPAGPREHAADSRFFIHSCTGPSHSAACSSLAIWWPSSTQRWTSSFAIIL